MARRARRHFVRLIDLLSTVGHEHPVALITGHRVVVNGKIVDNPTALVSGDASIVIRPERLLRGTLKLRAALAVSGVDPAGRICLDIGAAAGGFTIALLEAGASAVYAVDTGYGQLLGGLRQDRRVINLERTNLADLDRRRVPDRIDVVTIDLSYVPLADALAQLDRVAFSAGSDLLALIKPTFELRQGRPIRDRDDIDKAVELAVAAAESSGWQEVRTFAGSVEGRRHTLEVILHAKSAPRDGPDPDRLESLGE
jgi:23S rRNA (cytidine1920-2'-O)/16S rRNA (cytidine1409-2'-O)-methyltransferase